MALLTWAAVRFSAPAHPGIEQVGPVEVGLDQEGAAEVGHRKPSAAKIKVHIIKGKGKKKPSPLEPGFSLHSF